MFALQNFMEAPPFFLFQTQKQVKKYKEVEYSNYLQICWRHSLPAQPK